MKKKALAILLALSMVLTLLPTIGWATGETVIPADGAPTATGVNFFANGTPITIQAAAPAGGTSVTFAGFTAVPASGTAPDAYIVWMQASATNYIGVTNDVVVFGGAQATSGPVSVNSASITMTGGTVYRVQGGNLGLKGTATDGTLDVASPVLGNSNFTMTGGTVRDYVTAGQWNAAINGTYTIDISGGSFGSWCYIQGGIFGNGTEGRITTATPKTIESNAVVNNAVIRLKGINVDDNISVFGGGSGHTIVNSATVTIGDTSTTTKFDCLFVAGVNGWTKNCTLTVNNSTIEALAATNRGFLGTGTVALNNTTIKDLYTGGAAGCFQTDGRNASCVLDKITYNINAGSSVENAYLSPNLLRGTSDTYAGAINNLTIANSSANAELVLAVDEFTAKTSNPEIKIANYEISAAKTLTLGNNVSVAVADGASLANGGTFALSGKYTGKVNGSEATITVAPNGGTIANFDPAKALTDTTNTPTRASYSFNGWLQSGNTYTAQWKAGGVSASPSGGTFTSAVDVTLSTTTADGIIRYTLDGSDPTASSAAYFGAIPISTPGATTLKAAVFGSNALPGDVATFRYTITPKAATPVISPAGGSFNAPQQVSITCATQDAQIYYTTDGSAVSTGSLLYEGPFMVGEGTTVVQARAYKNNYANSGIASQTFAIAPLAGSVSASPGSGSYAYGPTVTLLTQLKNVQIRYTLDGSVPTLASPLYKAPITLSTTTTVLAKLYDASGVEVKNSLSSFHYIIGQKVKAPYATPSGGNYFAPTKITLGCTTPGATIHYTLDGSAPSANSPVYTSPFTLDSSATLRAIAVKDGYLDSNVSTYRYNVYGNFLLGDADLDGAITVADSMLTLRWVVYGGTPASGTQQFLSADVNKDGKLTTTDALWILQKALGNNPF